jgi:ketol-acid reductoisomerase
MGYSSQGPAHANNLRSSLNAAGSEVPVMVALREGSKTRELAEKDGFTVENGTLVTPEQGLARAAFVAMLIADGGMGKQGAEYLAAMREGSVLGLAHGFYQGFLEGRGQTIADVAPQLGGVVGVCPKGMGKSVRKGYEMGSGINTSFAVESGDRAQMTDLALAWSLGLGAPSTFPTTLGMEWRSDLVGERAMLLGGPHGLVEAVHPWKMRQGLSGEAAYIESVETLVGPISKTISKEGLMGVYGALGSEEDREKFARAYNATYPVLKHLTAKLYNDVSAGREIQEVFDDYQTGSPKPQVDGGQMWRDGERVRASLSDEGRKRIEIDPVVAGIYEGGMMAQVDVLRENGHHWSEVVNESIIEAVDSLNPYMEYNGVAFMIDNCSDTAQRGARKWGPQFETWIREAVLPVVDGSRIKDTQKPGMLLQDDKDYMPDFLSHPVHEAWTTFAQLRPPIDIAVRD